MESLRMGSEGLASAIDATRKRIKKDAQKALALLKQEIAEGEQAKDHVIVGYTKKMPNILAPTKPKKEKTLEEVWKEEDLAKRISLLLLKLRSKLE